MKTRHLYSVGVLDGQRREADERVRQTGAQPGRYNGCLFRHTQQRPDNPLGAGRPGRAGPPPRPQRPAWRRPAGAAARNRGADNVQIRAVRSDPLESDDGLERVHEARTIPAGDGDGAAFRKAPPRDARSQRESTQLLSSGWPGASALLRRSATPPSPQALLEALVAMLGAAARAEGHAPDVPSLTRTTLIAMRAHLSHSGEAAALTLSDVKALLMTPAVARKHLPGALLARKVAGAIRGCTNAAKSKVQHLLHPSGPAPSAEPLPAAAPRRPLMPVVIRNCTNSAKSKVKRLLHLGGSRPASKQAASSPDPFGMSGNDDARNALIRALPDLELERAHGGPPPRLHRCPKCQRELPTTGSGDAAECTTCEAASSERRESAFLLLPLLVLNTARPRTAAQRVVAQDRLSMLLGARAI